MILKKKYFGIPSWLIIAILLYVLLFTTFSHIRHNTYHSGWDLGVHENILVSSLNGKLFYNEDFDMNYLGNHFNIIILPLLPIYYLFSSTLLLFFLQSLLIAIAAIPLYKLSRLHLNEFVSKAITITYFFYPMLWNVNLEDFHFITFAIPVIVWLFYFIEEKKWNLYWIFFAILLSIKEDLSLFGVFLGFYLILKKETSQGIKTSLISALWFLIVINYLMPLFNTGDLFGEGYVFFNIRYEYLGSSIGEIIMTIITDPVYTLTYTLISNKLFYVIFFLRSLLFVPLLSLSIITTIPIVAINILSADMYQLCPTSHHSVHLIPILFVSFIFGVKRLLKYVSKKFVDRAIVLILILTIISSVIYWAIPFTIDNSLADQRFINGESCYKNEFKLDENNVIDDSQKYYSELNRKIQQLNKDKSITATTTIYPHLMNFEKSQSVHLTKNYFDTHYLFFDFTDYDSPFSEEITHKIQMIKRMGYREVWQKGEIYLFEKE